MTESFLAGLLFGLGIATALMSFFARYRFTDREEREMMQRLARRVRRPKP